MSRAQGKSLGIPVIRWTPRRGVFRETKDLCARKRESHPSAAAAAVVYTTTGLARTVRSSLLPVTKASLFPGIVRVCVRTRPPRSSLVYVCLCVCVCVCTYMNMYILCVCVFANYDDIYSPPTNPGSPHYSVRLALCSADDVCCTKASFCCSGFSAMGLLGAWSNFANGFSQTNVFVRKSS